MALKLVLVSPSGTLEKDGKLINSHIEELANTIAKLAAKGIRVAIWSNRKWTVSGPARISWPMEEYLSKRAGVEVQYVGLRAGMPARRMANSVVPILKKFGVSLHETILVGANDEDMIAGVNNKLMLLRPSWYQKDLAYGFELQSIEELARFCLLFGLREHFFFWHAKDEKRAFDAYALGPFSTMQNAYAEFGLDARNAAKFEAGTLEFWHQLVASTLYFSGLIHQVDFIAVYPGHAKDAKPKAFHEVLSLLGKCFRKEFLHGVIARHETAPKSTYQKAYERLFSNQINTVLIDLNAPKYGSKEPRRTPINLKGKRVLVVDDICTSGRSLDTARAYFEAAGATTVLFSWLKTVNTSFLSMDPTPKLLPYKANVFHKEPQAISYGYAQHIIDNDAAVELDEILKAYKAWKI